jgi:hypothetical protein
MRACLREKTHSNMHPKQKNAEQSNERGIRAREGE